MLPFHELPRDKYKNVLDFFGKMTVLVTVVMRNAGIIRNTFWPISFRDVFRKPDVTGLFIFSRPPLVRHLSILPLLNLLTKSSIDCASLSNSVRIYDNEAP
jgi:hypothetical protein